jgi:hypothetical protein
MPEMAGFRLFAATQPLLVRLARLRYDLKKARETF